jgi:hypothetical protein
MKPSRNAVIIPTRGRGMKIRDRILESQGNSGSSEFYLSIDEDDSSDYAWASLDGVNIIRGKNKGMNEALNRAATHLCFDYEFLTFMGDDHVARTENWDLNLIYAVEALGPASLAYGNDLLAGESLPTAVLVDSKLVQRLGYMAPPALRHMFLDDFWLELGSRSKKLAYLNDVVLEHLHFSVGKSELDHTYKKTNRNAKNLRDRLAYNLYKLSGLKSDLAKLKSSAY